MSYGATKTQKEMQDIPGLKNQGTDFKETIAARKWWEVKDKKESEPPASPTKSGFNSPPNFLSKS